MAVSAHERIGVKTRDMEAAIYAALDAIDAYVDTAEQVIAEQRASDEPNTKLIGRMEQFRDRGATMSAAIEDDVLTSLMHCIDRLFSVELAERGEFI